MITFPTTPPIDPATKGVRVILEDAARVRILDAIFLGGFARDRSGLEDERGGDRLAVTGTPRARPGS